MAGALRGVVAIDGPSGTGKTTVARKLAARFDIQYLDSGSLYRAFTLAVLRQGVAGTDEAGVDAVVRQAVVSISTDPAHPNAVLDGEDVTTEIRSSAVNKNVSDVSVFADVRALINIQLREIIQQALSNTGGIVVEGRDIGTIVTPDAPLKVFLTADAQIRLARRSAQGTGPGKESTVDEIRATMEYRDNLDSTRTVTPMRVADDAVVLDTSELTIDQVIVALGELAHQRGMLTSQATEVSS